MELKWIADREGRLSSFLLGELKMSSSLMNKLKWGDAIQVNGTPQRTNFPVKPGDLVTVRLDEEEPEFPAEDGPLTILYEYRMWDMLPSLQRCLLRVFRQGALWGHNTQN